MKTFTMTVAVDAEVPVEICAEDVVHELAQRYDIDRVLDICFEVEPYDIRDVQGWLEAQFKVMHDGHGPSLQHCPHCGEATPVHLATTSLPGEQDQYKVVCDFNMGGCGATGGVKETQLKAAISWNRRA